MDDPLLWQLLLQALLIFCNAVFSGAEIAVITMNDLRMEKLAEEGNRQAKRLKKLTSQPARFLATIQVAITLAGFLGSAFAADNFAERLVDLCVKAGWAIPVKTLNAVAVIMITLLLSYITLVFGELVPKRLAQRRAEKFALGISGLIRFTGIIFAPLVWLLEKSTNAVLRILGIDPNEQEQNVSEEEIRMMIDVGSERGAIEPEEKEMLQNVFAFGDTRVEEILTHRTDVVLLYLEDSDEEWREMLRSTRHSCYPVCRDTADKVVGVLKAREYFRIGTYDRDTVMRYAVTPARFVPESAMADDLFRDMQSKRYSFAVVVDEYGGMSGVVTMNDLLEVIVGDLDEPGEMPELIQTGEDTWQAVGTLPLEELAAAGIDGLPTEEFDTFGGWVFASLPEVPGDGTTFEITLQGLHIRVAEIRNRRIQKAFIEKLPPRPTEEE